MNRPRTWPSLVLGLGLLSGAVQAEADRSAMANACAEAVSGQALAAERQAVEYLRRAYAIAADRAGMGGEAGVEEARQIYRGIFTADADIRVVIDGQVTRRAQGPDAWLDEVVAALAPYRGVQHMIGTQWVDIECLPGAGRQGEARMSSYLQAWHDRDGEQLYMFIGTYYDQVRYVPDIGWQIHDMELRSVSTEKRAMGGTLTSPPPRVNPWPRHRGHVPTRTAEVSGVTLSKHQLLRAYRRMREIREFEERLQVENTTGEIPGFLHLYTGQEAIAVGICEHLSDIDYIGSTHRGHGHCIAKGCDLNGMMAEIYGKETGLCRGKGGSMHIADLERGMLGANAIVGGASPLAVGAALSARTLGTGGVSVAFTGDGGSNQGLVFEAMNMAVVLQLPVIFVFENNGYGEATGHDYAVGSRDIAGRAAGFGLPAVKVDGTDFFAVHEAMGTAVERARSGQGPSVIEAVAMRWRGHYEGDAMLYRAEGEVAELRSNKDPLKLFLQRVEGQVPQADIDAINLEAVAAIEEAVVRARAANPPSVEQLLTDVYVSY